MAFIRIRSPSKAPPVFRLEGSTDTTAMFLSLKSIKNLRTNSSTKDDFPAPPVPVIPNTGVPITLAFFLMSANTDSCISAKFSAAEITRAIEGTSETETVWALFGRVSPTEKSHCFTKSLIIP